MADTLSFKYLQDEPQTEQTKATEFFHSSIVPALRDILQNESCVHTIGLFSKWGTGKSTIIEMVRSSNEFNRPMFVFDTWKYQGDALRRTFLLQFVDFVSKLTNKKEPEAEKRRVLAKLYKTVSVITDQQSDSTDNNIKNYKKLLSLLSKNKWFIILMILLAAVPVAGSLALEKWPMLNQLWTRIINFFMSLSGTLFLSLAFFSPIAKKVFTELTDRITKSILPVAKIREVIETEERFNSPEQFEALFKQLLAIMTEKGTAQNGIVVVFDNIDRVHGSTAINMLSTIKTFLEPNDSLKVTIIVPCDSEAIKKQLKHMYGDDYGDYDSSEYLRKLFNVVIWMPEFIEEDFYTYIKSIIAETGDIKKLLNKEDVLLIIRSAFSNNPRQIKQFINNLISAIVLASQTEVWEVIKNNIAYLAKMLVLKQRYPEAFLILKQRWFDPESVTEYFTNDNNHDEEVKQQLKGFMLNTSRITVKDAEPFIYFKKSTILNKLPNAEDLRKVLIDGNTDKAKRLIKDETYQLNDLIDFIESLIKKFSNQPSLLKKIFVTHIQVFKELEIKINKINNKPYFDLLVRTLDDHLWRFYPQLPTELIFSYILTRENLDERIRQNIFLRYAKALKDKENKQFNKPELVVDIFTNLKKSVGRLDSIIIQEISHSIDKHYSTNGEVISLFKEVVEQKLFILPSAFEKFISNINNNSFVNNSKIILQYQHYIIENELFEHIFQNIISVVKNERANHPEYRKEKDLLMDSALELLCGFKKEIPKATEETITQLIDVFITTFKGISDWDGKTSVINNLRLLLLVAPQSYEEVLSKGIQEFLSHANINNINTVLGYWDKEQAHNFVADFFSVLKERCNHDKDCLTVVYDKANFEQKKELVESFININKENSLEWIQDYDKNISGEIRKIVVDTFLEIAESSVQVEIIEYLATQLRGSDSDTLISSIAKHIEEFLKSEDQSVAESGYNILIKNSILDETNKRNIRNNIFNWLQQSRAQLNTNHAFALKAYAHMISIRPNPDKENFISIVFHQLKQESGTEVLQMSIEILEEIKIRYPKYKSYFDDFYARLSVWPKEQRVDVIEGIQKLKSNTPNDAERIFWKKIGALSQEADE